MILGNVGQVLTGEARAHVAHADVLDFLRSLPDGCADILVTDPPYSSGGLSRSDRAKSGAASAKYSRAAWTSETPEIEGDSRDQRSWAFWCALWLTAARRTLAPGAIAAVFCDWRQVGALQDALQAGGFIMRGLFPWTKGSGRPCLGRFTNDAEYVVWGTKGAREVKGAAHPGHFIGRTPKAERFAVCSKSIALMEALVAPCLAGGVVLDPFVGWGATPVAALRSGRRFLGSEISPVNRATALERLEREGGG